MTRADPSHLPPDLLDRVCDVVAQVVLEQTGRAVTVAPDDPLVDHHLEPVQLTDLALALQQRLDLWLEPAELNRHTMSSARVIAALALRRTTCHAGAADAVRPRTVTILGGGKIGRMVAHFLGHAGRGRDYRLRVGDLDAGASHAVIAGLEDAEGHAVDFGDAGALDRVLAGADAVVSCAPFHCNPLIAERAKAQGAHYLDLTEDVAVTEKVVALAQDADTAFVPQCGLAPGFITIVAKHLIADMRDISRLSMRVGALPRYPNNRLKYNLTWSTEGLINEYCNPCEVIHDGELQRVEPLEDLEELTIDGAVYEAFNTSGGLGSMAQSLLGRVRNVNYKSVRYPGHAHLLKVLLEDLGMRDQRELLRDILDKNLPTTPFDQIVIYVSATGMLRGRLTQNTYARTIYHQEIDGQHWSGIQVTTAAGVCAVLDLLFEGRIPQHGFVRQEDVDYTAFIRNRFGRYYH